MICRVAATGADRAAWPHSLDVKVLCGIFLIFLASPVADGSSLSLIPYL
jgi:hypothetical protein